MTPSITTPRVLIIDDDRAIARAIATRLENCGYCCVIAHTGAQGFIEFDGCRADLVITDLNMPAGDGVVFARRLRGITDVPIIVVTAFRHDYDSRLGSLARVAVLEKPFQSNDLLELVEAELSGPDPDGHLETHTKERTMPCKRILIADDDPAVLKLLSIRLQHAGFDVLQVSDAYQALQAARREKPDLLILDVHMPAGEGFSVQQRIETDEGIEDIPVIYLTGDKSARVDQSVKRLGAFAVLYKPLDKEQLLTAVRAALGYCCPS